MPFSPPELAAAPPPPAGRCSPVLYATRSLDRMLLTRIPLPGLLLLSDDPPGKEPYDFHPRFLPSMARVLGAPDADFGALLDFQARLLEAGDRRLFRLYLNPTQRLAYSVMPAEVIPFPAEWTVEVASNFQGTPGVLTVFSDVWTGIVATGPIAGLGHDCGVGLCFRLPYDGSSPTGEISATLVRLPLAWIPIPDPALRVPFRVEDPSGSLPALKPLLEGAFVSLCLQVAALRAAPASPEEVADLAAKLGGVLGPAHPAVEWLRSSERGRGADVPSQPSRLLLAMDLASRLGAAAAEIEARTVVGRWLGKGWNLAGKKRPGTEPDRSPLNGPIPIEP